MSKKDRLKAQSEKQLQLKLMREQHEKELYESSKNNSSMAVAKLKKQATDGINNNLVMIIIKVLMIIPFGYSAFFYGGVTIVGIVFNELTDIPKRIAGFMGVGIILCGAAIFFAFFKKYILQFILSLTGTISFLYGGQFIINKITYKLNNSYVADADLKTMDKTYMWYYYPILIMTFLSAVLLGIAIVNKIRKKRKDQIAKDNAPVKSIVDGD